MPVRDPWGHRGLIGVVVPKGVAKRAVGTRVGAVACNQEGDANGGLRSVLRNWG